MALNKETETETKLLGSIEYPFIAITPRSTLTWSDGTC